MKRFYQGVALACVLIINQACATGPDMPVSPANLDQYQWKNRVLIVFAESRQEKPYQAFDKQLRSHAAGLEERHLRVFRVFSDPRGDAAPASLDGGKLDKRDAMKLLEGFDYAGSPPVRVVLIGKDGGVKLDTPEPELEQLFARIDAMPMRRAEMRAQ